MISTEIIKIHSKCDKSLDMHKLWVNDTVTECILLFWKLAMIYRDFPGHFCLRVLGTPRF